MERRPYLESQILQQNEISGIISCAELSGGGQYVCAPDEGRNWQYLFAVEKGEIKFHTQEEKRSAGSRCIVNLPVRQGLLSVDYSPHFKGWCLGVDLNALIEFFRREDQLPGHYRRHFRDFMILENKYNPKQLFRDFREISRRLGERASHHYSVNVIYALFCVTMADFADFLDYHLASRGPVPNKKRGETLMIDFMKVASQNIERKHNVDWYANELCVSPSYLGTVIREQTGFGVGKVLSMMRYEKAINYVSRSSLALGEIAFKLGFPDLPTFSRFFKRHCGRSPQAYRQSIKQ